MTKLPSAVHPRPHETGWLRKLAFAGARYGPAWFLRLSPPVIGAAFAVALPDARRRVLESLRWTLGPRAATREQWDVLRTFSDYAACFAEALAAERPEASRATVDVKGLAHLRAVAAAGHGALVVTAHVGPWDVAARLLAAELGNRVLVVMEGEPDAGARAFHDDVRRRSGVEVVTVGSTPLDALPVLRHLRSGGFVAFQIDRAPPNGRTLATTLFGRTLAVPEGPFRLGALSGAPILPLFSWRRGYFDYGVEVGAPIACRKAAGDLQRAAQATVDQMQRFIGAHPTQWFHFGGGG